MIKNVIKGFTLLLSIASLTILAHAQDIPAVTGPVSYEGFQLPTTLGTLTYGLSGSAGTRTGYTNSGGNVMTINGSGEVGYLSNSTTHPFTLTYSGGYVYYSSGLNSAFFQNLTLTQGFNAGRYKVLITDNVSYLPEAPVGGLSGVPGLGDIGVSTTPSTNGTDILTGQAARAMNTISGNVSRDLTGSTSVSVGGTYFIQRFVGDTTNLYAIDQATGNAGLTHRVNALSSLQVNYSYSDYTYPASHFSFISQSVAASYQRNLSRRLIVHIGGGPQITSTSPRVASLPLKVDFGVDGGLKYSRDRMAYAVSFVRSVQSGSGVVQGTVGNTASISAARRLNRVWQGGLEAEYARHTQLNSLSTTPFTFDAIVGGIQLSRTIGESLSMYGSYSAQKQSGSNLPNVIVFNGLSQVATVGITYAPRAIHLGHQ